MNISKPTNKAITREAVPIRLLLKRLLKELLPRLLLRGYYQWTVTNKAIAKEATNKVNKTVHPPDCLIALGKASSAHPAFSPAVSRIEH